MKYISIIFLFLCTFSIFSVMSCSQQKDKNLSQTWDNIINVVRSDPLKDYTALIYSHSIQPTADKSLIVSDICLINSEGLSKNDLIALIELDYQQAKKCWEGLLEYPSSDKRFFVKDTVEYKIWQKFLNKKDEYAMLFNPKDDIE